MLILQHCYDLVCAFFGAILAGAIPAIMPFLTEKLLPERYRADLAALVSVTQPAAIVTYPEFAVEVQAALRDPNAAASRFDSASLSPPETSHSVRAVIVCDRVQPLRSPPDFASLPGMRCAPQDTVLLQHSSGTTGLQKGVALSHQAVLNQLAAYSAVLQLTPEDVIVSWLPLYHDMGLIAGFLMPILSGNRLVIMSPFDWVRAPVRLLQAVAHYRGHPLLAAQFCLQLLRRQDPRARPGGPGPVLLALDQ